MKLALTLIVLALFAAPASAADKKIPGSIDGPQGCGWHAAILEIHKGDDPTIDFVLTQKISKCAFEPGPCGTKDDHISAPVKKEDLYLYHPGQITKLWVTKGNASVDIPTCTKTSG